VVTKPDCKTKTVTQETGNTTTTAQTSNC
jgi:hypothetical protein